MDNGDTKLVGDILKNDVNARNSDAYLISKCLGTKKIVLTDELIGRINNITRIRRAYQSFADKYKDRPKYLPTDPEVMRARRMKEEKVKAHLGYLFW